MAKARERDRSQWIVHGQRRNSPWIMLIITALIVAAIVFAYLRVMAFRTVTYEVLECQSPLTAQSTWAQVEAAGCESIDANGEDVTLVLFEGSSAKEAESVQGGTFTFEGFPINTPAHSFELRGVQPADSGLLVDPEAQSVRREMRSDASGSTWSGFTGGRGPTEYWILLSPRS